MEQLDHVFGVDAGVDLPFLEEEAVKDLPGLGNVVLLFEVHQLVVLEHFVQGIEEGRGDLVAHREGLQAGQAGVFQAVDAAAQVAVDEDVFVLVDDPPVVRMFVHHVDADALLLVFVDAEALGELLQAVEFLVGDRLVGQVELLEGVMVGLVLFVDQLDQVEGALVAEQAEELLAEARVVPLADGLAAFEQLAEQAQNLLLLLPQRAGDRTGQEEEVVADGVALEKDPLETLGCLRCGR